MNAIDDLEAAFEELRTLGYYCTHADAEVAADRPQCRCCIIMPEGIERYVVAAGGADTETTTQWMLGHGQLSWQGDGDEIRMVLGFHNIATLWNGSEERCIEARFSTESLKRLPAIRDCGHYEATECECWHDEWDDLRWADEKESESWIS